MVGDMRILVLGGGGFLGWAVARQAMAAGHEVTTFSRGRQPVPDGVTAVHGDRDDPSPLGGREYDAVIDTSGQIPRDVLASARLLADATPHYVYVSSMSAVTDWPAEPVDHTSPTRECPPDAGPDDERYQYGERKAGAERAVLEVFGPDRSTIVRSGLIIGPREDRNSPRLPWWLLRMARGGPVLAPGDRDRPFAAVDVRDLAAWLIHCAQGRVAGAFCTDPQPGWATMIDLLDFCRHATGSDAVFTWVPDDFLLKHEVEPWWALPFWLPPDQGSRVVDSSAALAAGLRCRPLRETVVDTWASMRAGETTADSPARDDRPALGIEPEREKEVLAAWWAFRARQREYRRR